MENKFELLKNDYISVQHPVTGKTVKLHRIISLRSFDVVVHSLNSTNIKFEKHIKEYQVGGYVQDQTCLSQFDNSWIDGNAKVFNGSVVEGNSYVGHNAHIYDNSNIIDESYVVGYAHVGGGCMVKRSVLEDSATIFNASRIYSSIVRNHALVRDNAVIQNCFINGGSVVEKNSYVKDSYVTDMCGIINSKVTACVLSGRTVFKDEHADNKTIDTVVDLNIEVPSVDLSQHGII